jgi:hypothetical protein
LSVTVNGSMRRPSRVRNQPLKSTHHSLFTERTDAAGAP